MSMNPNSTGLDNITMIYFFNGSVDTNTSANRSIANYNISNMSLIIARNSGQNESSFNVTVGFTNDSNVSDAVPQNNYNYTFANTSINRTNGAMENTSTNSLNITGGNFCSVDQVNSYNFNSSVINPANNLSVFTNSTNITLQNFTNLTTRTGFNNIVSCILNLTSNFSFVNTSTGIDARAATIIVNQTENLTFNFNNSNSTSIAVVNNSLNNTAFSGLNNTTDFSNTTTAIRDPNNNNGTFLNNATVLITSQSFAPEIRFTTAPDATVVNQTIGSDNTTTLRYSETQTYAADSTVNGTLRTTRNFAEQRVQLNTTEIEPITNVIFFNFNYSAGLNESLAFSNATTQNRQCLYKVFNTSSTVGTSFSEFNCSNTNCTDPANPNRCIAVVVSNFSDPNFNGDNQTRATRYNTISDNRTSSANNSFLFIDYSENSTSSNGNLQRFNLSRDTALINTSRDITFNASTSSLVNSSGNVTDVVVRNFRQVISPVTTTPVSSGFQRYYDSSVRNSARPNADGARTENFNEVILIDNVTDINPVPGTRATTTTPAGGVPEANPDVVNNFTRNLVQTNYSGPGAITLPDTQFLNQTQRLRNINALDIVYINANNLTLSQGNLNSTTTNPTDVTNATTFNLAYEFVFGVSTLTTPQSQQACRYVNNTERQVYRNGTVALQGQEIRTCRFNNGSDQVRTTSYDLYYHPNGTTVGTNGFFTTGGNAPDNTVSALGSPSNPAPVSNTNQLGNGNRRLLMEKNTNKHFQGTNTTVTGGNFIWVSCFTGFGEASLININSIVDNQPTMDNCITRINAERPNFTVEKLRVAVNTFLAQNPGAN